MIDIPPPAIHLNSDPPAPIESQLSASIDGSSYVFRDEAILGTRMQINLVARNFSDAKAAAISARNEIDQLNAILNTRDPESEISILNRSRTHRASSELFAVIEAAERWRTESANAFSGRLGRAIALWNSDQSKIPSRTELARVAREADEAHVHLDSATQTITRPDEVEFALDAIAKGWIVDRAFDVASTSPGVSGALIDIGGDIRCGGQSPDAKGWCIDIPDARVTADNAPMVARTYLSNHAIATSGSGSRDRIIDGVRYGQTLSPKDGWPIQHATSVTAIASSAAEADAMATMLLSLPTKEAVEYANRDDIAARIVTNDDVVLTRAALSGSGGARVIPISSKKKEDKSSDANRWPKDWMALLTFTAPPRQLARDQHFRSPYVAMWISDLDNKPIRTLLLIGTHLDWQSDNYIWWSLNGDNVKHLSGTRSMSTASAGLYKMQWDGTDDQFKEVPAGTYVLHVETSRERGKHTHRELTLDFSKGKAFTDQLPTSDEAGGVRIDFYRQ